MKFLKRFFKWLLIVFVFIFCILSIIPYFFSEHLKEAPAKPFENSYFFEFNHTRFHYRLFIPKHITHKVVMIHGFSGSTFSFRNNIDSLVSHHALVVAIDMPAFGFSDKSEDGDYNDFTKINGIHFLLQQIDKHSNSKKWHLVGHSMGGITTGQFASKYSELTQSLIFIDGLPFMQVEHSFLQKMLLYPPLLKWADVILERNFLSQQSFHKLLSSAYDQDADSISTDGYMKPFETKGSGSAVIRMGANYNYPSFNDSIINALPKLIIWGAKDQWVPIVSATDYLSKPNTQQLIIEDAGHCPMETHPEKVNTTITDFISKLD